MEHCNVVQRAGKSVDGIRQGFRKTLKNVELHPERDVECSL